MGTTSQKLTYLSETKTQLKDMINYGLDTGEKITSETTFRNYVKSLFDAFIKTMTYPDVLYNNLPKITGEGTSVTLNGTVYAPMRVELSPSALEQETSILPSEYTQVDYIESTGTQYIDTGVKPSSDTKIDIDFAYLDSTYNGYTALFGERGATSDTYFGLYINKTDGKLAINYSQYDGGASSTTTISRNVKYNIKNDYGSFYLNNASTPFQNTTQTLTTSTTSVYLLEQHLYNGSSQSRGMQAKIYQCKFYEGSTLTRNFIPCYRNSDNEIGMYDLANDVFYTNQGTGTFVKGNDSVLPNPDYPQQIHTVSGENEVKIQNVNIWDEQWELGFYDGIGNPESGNSNIRSKNNKPIYINSSLNYYIKSPNNIKVFISQYKKDGTFINRDVYQNQIFTPNINTSYIKFNLASTYGTVYKNDVCINVSNENINGNYYSHQEQSLSLSLGDLEYCKIGDYEDLFFKNVVGSEYYDSTLELNKWYLKKNIGKVVLDGSESGWFNDGGGAPYAIHVPIKLNNSKLMVMSDYFIGVKYNASWTVYDALVSTSIQTAVNPSIKFRYTGNTGGVEGFKTWLSTHNTTVYYVLATPTYTLLSDTLQTQLEAIWKANSYEEQTNVSQTNADLPFVLSLSAIEDLG